MIQPPTNKQDKRGLARYNKTVAAVRAAAQPLLDQQDDLDMEGLQQALLSLFTDVLGTAPERSEITEAWMTDPVVQDYLFLYRTATKQYDKNKTAANATNRNQAQKKLRWAKTQAITKARLATVWHITQGGNTTLFFRDLKQRRDPRTDTAYPHLDRQRAVAAWSSILQRPANQEGPAASTMPPLTDHITLTFEKNENTDETLEAICKTKNKSSGPDRLDARGVKVLAPVLHPLYRTIFNKALQTSLPVALKRCRTGLVAKKDKTSTDSCSTDPSAPYLS
jgi:uncharacterized phage-associated protein